MRISFVTKSGRDFSLDYEIFSHPVAKAWMELVGTQPVSGSDVFNNGLLYGTLFATKEEISEQMSEVLEIIKKYLNVPAPHVPHNQLTSTELNELHEYFERFSVLPEFSEVNNPVCANAFSKLNTLIHQFEVFLGDDTGCFMEILPTPRRALRLAPKGFQHFTPDSHFGGLYITYGTTGVPYLNSFMWNTERPGIPQTTISNGFTLSFRNDSYFNRWKELEGYLKEYSKVDINNPEVGIGYIPVGRLITPYENRQQLDSDLKDLRGIKSYSLHQAKEHTPLQSQAHWPTYGEIHDHLDFTPFVDLKFNFDHQACFREAIALADRFIEHRNYDQSSSNGAKWKSLALKAVEGDSQKTRYHTDYGIIENPNYEFTDVAKLCPNTMFFLSSIVDLKQCQRIRFMLLEPGAKIHVHSDLPDKDVGFALNIALNQPKNCNFWIDTNPDGSHNPYTRRVPFFPGTVMGINNAKYHYVENLSDQPRIHLIVHGPIKFKEEYVLQCARRQNGFWNTRSLVTALAHKTFFLTHSKAAKKVKMLSEFRRVGLVRESVHPAVKILRLKSENANNFTPASLFPLDFKSISKNEIEDEVSRLTVEGYRFAVIIHDGTFITDTSQFVVQLTQLSSEMLKRNIPVCGHIMDGVDIDRPLPFFHEQFLVLDLKYWKDFGAVPLNSSNPINFPGYIASEEKFHDHYTPHFLYPRQDLGSQLEMGGWGTELMAKYLSRGMTIMNVPQYLRDSKKYSYPGENPKLAKPALDAVYTFLQNTQSKVYCFNNEPLKISHYNDFKPDHFVSVSSGFKPFSLLNQFWKNRSPLSVTFVDFSQNSLNFIRKLVSCRNSEEIQKLIRDIERLVNQNPATLDMSALLKGVLEEGFEGQFQHLLDAFGKASLAEYQHMDFVGAHEDLFQLLTRGKTLFWHSNAWNNNAVFLFNSPEDLQRKYFQLGCQIANHLGMNLWQNQTGSGFEFIVGTSLNDPHVVLTDGCSKSGAFYFQTKSLGLPLSP